MAALPTAEDSELVLQARSLAFAYGRNTPVFEDISIDIHNREIVCLLGASGCGKSTLLRTMSLLETPLRGELRFLGERLREAHPSTALLFQQPSLLPWLNVHANVGFGLNLRRQPVLDQRTRERRIEQALEGVGLAGHERDYPAQLSGGMAQRVALARALAREPRLLFADEPFSSLDAITRGDMQSLLVDLVHRWHTAVLLVTHDIDEAIFVGDRILLMGGRPGHIAQEWRVDIPYPREAETEQVTRLRLQILTALRAQRPVAAAA